MNLWLLKSNFIKRNVASEHACIHISTHIVTVDMLTNNNINKSSTFFRLVKCRCKQDGMQIERVISEKKTEKEWTREIKDSCTETHTHTHNCHTTFAFDISLLMLMFALYLFSHVHGIFSKKNNSSPFYTFSSLYTVFLCVIAMHAHVRALIHFSHFLCRRLLMHMLWFEIYRERCCCCCSLSFHELNCIYSANHMDNCC